MARKYTKKLDNLINRFNKKLEEAKDARSDVMAYIEERYGIDVIDNYERFEEETDWCYGIDKLEIRNAIDEIK